MDMTPQRWKNTCQYLADVFGTQDTHLDTLMRCAVVAGLPDIAISPDVGRFLHILTKLANAQNALEIGTLAGYSGIWIARALAPGGTLHTIEIDPGHADFAQRAFQDAGVADRVRIHRGAALDILPDLAAKLGPSSIDVAFLDGIKTEYTDYFRLVKPLIRPRGLLLADNTLGSDDWWIDQPEGESESRDAINEFDRLVAADEDFETVAVPIRQGILVAMRKSD